MSSIRDPTLTGQPHNAELGILKFVSNYKKYFSEYPCCSDNYTYLACARFSPVYIMSNTPAHLEQEPLVSPKANEALNNFDKWLCSAKFEEKKGDNFQQCVDEKLDEASQLLLQGLDFYKKVSKGIMYPDALPIITRVDKF